MTETTEPPTCKRSNKRQRTALVAMRFTPIERASLIDRASAAQMDVAAYVRHQTLGTAGPRAKRRRITADLAALAELRGELGYVGNNLNQLTRLANIGDMDRPADLDSVLTRLAGLLAQIDRALRGSE
jgi:hypothetical protein